MKKAIITIILILILLISAYIYIQTTNLQDYPPVRDCKSRGGECVSENIGCDEGIEEYPKTVCEKEDKIC